jgi:hypothetical protein
MNPASRMPTRACPTIHPYFSPDGKYLLFNSTRDNGSLDVYRLDLATRELLRITDSPMQETCARYSPDMTRSSPARRQVRRTVGRSSVMMGAC